MNKKISILLAFLVILSAYKLESDFNEMIPKFDKILQNPTVQTKYEIPDSTPFHQVVIPMNVGSNQLKDSLLLKKLKNAHVKYITYVYSSYKKAKEFKQSELNRERFSSLHHYLPELYNSDEVVWNTILQSGAQTEDQVNKLFHGFVIHYRPKATIESMKKEIRYVKNRIDTALTFIAPTHDEKTLISIVKGVEVNENYLSVDPMIYGESDSISISIFPVSTSGFGTYFKDTTVVAVLNRNKHWNKMLINCDLTGSMSPYSAQLFIWHQLNIDKKKVQHFVFFNDGNRKPDNKKSVGKTGGIYYSKADSFGEVKKVAFQCMASGFGGDVPENDIEAMLKGFKKCKNCNDVILIADNCANMRDYELINKIDRPVRVILCGTQFGINKQYLDLARATNGSIHTIEKDIVNLMKIKEGGKITISGHVFKIKNGRFIELKK